MKNKIYPLADRPDYKEIGRFIGPCLSREVFYKAAMNIRAIRTGEKRPPKKGEWYLSGAIVEAYRAPKDLTTAYHIAKLVMTKTTTTIKTEIV